MIPLVLLLSLVAAAFHHPASAVEPMPPAVPRSDTLPDAEILRDGWGIPHIRAATLEDAGFALAWTQLEDYGARVVRGLLEARGEMGLHFGVDSAGGDVDARLGHRRAVAGFVSLEADTRAVYRGFARGVNRWVELNPERLGADVIPGGVPRFAAADVLARDVVGPTAASSVLRRLEEDGVDAVLARADGTLLAGPPGGEASPDEAGGGDGRRSGPDPAGLRPDPGSNAWALGPSRTASGHAILLRNPHLSWDAGYYEAHVTVPGVLDFYGDFRIGGPFGIIGGFNRRLGWATTNNGPDREEVYALRLDPDAPDHVLLDGGSVPLTRITVPVALRNGDAVITADSTRWASPLGPVVARTGGWAFVVRSVGDGEIRLGQQFLAMMRSTTLEAWTDAMRIHARVASNFTYADADGRIAYVWNAATPRLPHAPGGDTLAFVVRETGDAWTERVPWDELPRLVDPAGGYLHNENDPFHWTAPDEPFDADAFPDHFPEPRLRLRSQHSIELLEDARAWTLDDVVREKHSPRMLLAERVLDEMLAAVRAGAPTSQEAEAVELLDGWDRTVARNARGGILFRAWWDAYRETLDDDEEPFAEPWSPDRPRKTPRGIAHPEVAARTLSRAMEEATRRFGSWEAAWGEVHRARVGGRDRAVAGCSGSYGCFRVLWFRETDDGHLAVRGGDGWVLAVEFGEVPRARSVLAYGQSPDPDHPHCCDQLDLFVDGRMKEVAFTAEAVDRAAVRRYRPGVR
jgi:acyl-homoserine-lactone acylase